MVAKLARGRDADLLPKEGPRRLADDRLGMQVRLDGRQHRGNQGMALAAAEARGAVGGEVDASTDRVAARAELEALDDRANPPGRGRDRSDERRGATGLDLDVDDVVAGIAVETDADVGGRQGSGLVHGALLLGVGSGVEERTPRSGRGVTG
jgi:hypothetical protein